MRKKTATVEQIRNGVKKLQGETVDMRVDLGRKRIVFKRGVIESVYPSVFTVKISDSERGMETFSYTDILCGGLLLRKSVL